MPVFSSVSQTSAAPDVTGTASSVAPHVTIAITTTFTPAATCNPTYLTQLSSAGGPVWVAEPVPVSSSTASDCYPSEWIQHYATAGPSGTSSIAPFVNSLICPSGWSSAFGAAGGYMACCPESYLLAQPSSLVDPNRPAYGGTCFSDVAAGATVSITAYGDASVTATAEWVVGTSGSQVYAHPIDGIAYQPRATTDDGRQPLSGGAIAGIVIGAVVGVVLIAAGLFFSLRRARQMSARRSRYALEADSDHVIRWVSEMSSEKIVARHGDDSAQKLTFDASSTTVSELTSPASRSGSSGHR